MLHCIAENSLTLSVVERIGAGDDVVLMSESVWAAYVGHQHNALLQALLQKSCRVFAMQDLVQVFGIDPSRLLQGVEDIDYDALVELTEHHPQILTWC
jgi:tRNA 2-thiouridine synthesizing protein B